MLSIRGISKYEQLSGRSLLTLSIEEVDLCLLSYCTLSGQEGLITYDEYKIVVAKSPKVQRSRELSIYKELLYLGQFKSAEATDWEDATEDGEEKRALSITELGAMLVAKGLTASFVYDEMELWMLPNLLKAVYSQARENMEDKRLWTFLQLSPYRTEGTTLQDLYTFPWEKQEVAKRIEEEQARNIEDIELIKHIQWQD